MTCSTNNDPTNPFSARSMTDRYLMGQALRTNRSEMGRLLKKRLSISSDSESDDDRQPQEIRTNIVVKKSKLVYKSLSTRDMKTLPSRESSFILKNLILSCCCIR
ncbi:MAG TPA: hypothetical protein VGZ69_05125 [Candidatus Rhabdochlamydia sp.]|jgi:hypothetical protein|nr:hypothetical protein [Candidatus Rhabdochlamydia sp.]